MNYIFTMTLEEIYALKNVTVTEDDHYVYVTPEPGYYLVVAEYPEDLIYYDTLKMLKQANYSRITVKCTVEPSAYSDDSIWLTNDCSTIEDIIPNITIF